MAVENCNVSALDNMFRTPLHWAAVLGKWSDKTFLYQGSLYNCCPEWKWFSEISLNVCKTTTHAQVKNV